MINNYGIRYIFGRTFPIPQNPAFDLGPKSWRIAITGIGSQGAEISPFARAIDWGDTYSPHLDENSIYNETIPYGLNGVPALVGGVFAGHHQTIVGNGTQDQSTSLSVIDNGNGVSICSNDICIKNNASWRPLGQTEDWHRPWTKLPWEPAQGFPYHTPFSWNHPYGDAGNPNENLNVRCWSWFVTNNRWRASTMPVGNVVVFAESSGGSDKGLILGYSRFYRSLQLRPQESVCISYRGWFESDHCSNKFLYRLIHYALNGDNADFLGSNWTLRLCSAPLNTKSPYEEIIEIEGEGYTAKPISSWSVYEDTLTGHVAESFINTSADTDWSTITHVVVTCSYPDDMTEQEGIGNPAFWYELPEPRTLMPGDTLALPDGIKLKLEQHD